MRPWHVWCRRDGAWRQVGTVNAASQRQAADLALQQYAAWLGGREWHVRRGLTRAEAEARGIGGAA
jgi:hypothetical protein